MLTHTHTQTHTYTHTQTDACTRSSIYEITIKSIHPFPVFTAVPSQSPADEVAFVVVAACNANDDDGTKLLTATLVPLIYLHMCVCVRELAGSLCFTSTAFCCLKSFQVILEHFMADFMATKVE